MEFINVRVKDLLGEIKVEEIINTGLPTLNPSMTIIDALKDQFFQTEYGALPVTSGSKVLGLITLSNVKRLPRSQWNTIKVSEVMERVSNNNSLNLEDKAVVALTKMIKTRLDLLPVVEDSKLMGIVTQDGLLRLIEHMKEGDSSY